MGIDGSVLQAIENYIALWSKPIASLIMLYFITFRFLVVKARSITNFQLRLDLQKVSISSLFISSMLCLSNQGIRVSTLVRVASLFHYRWQAFRSPRRMNLEDMLILLSLLSIVYLLSPSFRDFSLQMFTIRNSFIFSLGVYTSITQILVSIIILVLGVNITLEAFLVNITTLSLHSPCGIRELQLGCVII